MSRPHSMSRSFGFLLTLLAGILSSSCARGQDSGTSAQNAAPASSAFETFVVARPVSASKPTTQTPQDGPFLALRVPGTVATPSDTVTPGGTDMAGEAILTLFPGISGLETNAAGQWQGHALEANLHPGDWLRHGLENDPGFVEMGGEDRRAERRSDDGLNGLSGLRLLTPLAGHNGSVGFGLYRTDASLVPGMNGLWRMGDMRLTAQAGIDSSWRLQSQTRGGRIETDGFAERIGNTGAIQCGMACSTRLSKDSTLFQRLIYRPNGHGLAQWSLGGIQRVGKGLLSLDNLTAPLAGSRLHQMTIAFHVPLKRQYLSLGWQQSELGRQKDRQMQAMSLLPLSRSLTGWLGESLQWQPGGGAHSLLTVGASFTPGGRWSARAEWSQNQPFTASQAGNFRIHASLGYQYSPNLQVRILCGPSPTGGVNDTFHPAWGLQITRRFQYRAAPQTGSIQGRVLLDGLPCTQPLAIAVDGQEQVKIGRDGGFRIRRLPAGRHSIGLALSTLPADLNPLDAPISLDVGTDRTPPLVLRVARVGQVRGHLTVEADEFGATDPTAGECVTVTDDAGHATTTDANGDFMIGNLPTGSHTLHLVVATLPPHYCVLSPLQVRADIVPGHPQPAVQFLVAPERRPVQFSTVPTSPSPSDAQGG